MNADQLATLSARFQAVYRVFDPGLRNALTLAQGRSMDNNAMLGLLERQLRNPTGLGESSIRLGTAGAGTFNGAQHRIDVDPISLSGQAGDLTLRIAHEIGHTLDPNGTVGFAGHANPNTYASDRAQGEGFALLTEYNIFSDPGFRAANSLSNGQLAANGTWGDRVFIAANWNG